MGGALRGVAFVGGRLSVGEQCGGVEAGFPCEFALRASAGVEVGVVRPGASGTGWWLGVAKLVMPKS